MKLNILLFLFMVPFFGCVAKKESDFEKMLEGFPECKFENVYVDYETHKPQHRYFTDRKMVPNKVENGAAFFDVDELFQGLPVSQILISAGYDMVAIIIDEPISSVEPKLKKYLRAGYNKNWPVGGDILLPWPSLKTDVKDLSKTILFCDFEPQY